MATPNQPPQDRLEHLQAELAKAGFALPGTINVQMRRCGKQNCACQTDPSRRHGPYVTWTRKANGKTITRALTPEQRQRYQPWIENDRKLRDLIRQIEALSLELAEQTEGWA